jgi:hypothetical protein
MTSFKELTMPKISDMQPSKYLKATDAEDGDLILTMSTVKEETLGMGRDADKKWVLYFEEHPKGLVLNKTNMNTIAKLYGDDTDDWEGKKVTLFATEVQFKDEMVEALRIRSKPPKARETKKPDTKAPVTAAATREAGSDDDQGDDDDAPF